MFLLLLGSLIYLFIYAQRRKIKYILERERAEAIYENELLTSRIETAEQTLQNISWELHDNIGQLLSVASLQIKLLSSKCKKEKSEDMSEISEVIADCLHQVRTLSKSLDPKILKHNGIEASLLVSLQRIKRLVDIDYKIEIEQDIKWKNDQEIIVFRMLQEFIANTIKHAKATFIHVNIIRNNNVIEVSIEDDGVGFEVDKVSLNSGLIHMKSRAEILDANFKLESSLGEGTKMKVCLPIDFEND